MTVTSVADAPAPVDKVTRERWMARRTLWSQSTIKSVRMCGRVPISKSGIDVHVITTPDGRRNPVFTNVHHCASVWACPTCSYKILTKRIRLVAEAARRWRYQALEGDYAAAPKPSLQDGIGGTLAMLTLTVRHSETQSLEQVWSAVAKAWAAATAGRVWSRDQDLYGVPMEGRGGKVRNRIGFMRVWDMTVDAWGHNGWHPHAHVLLFLRGDVTDAEIQTLGESMWDRWDRAAQAEGLEGGIMVDDAGESVGMEIHRVYGDQAESALGEYFGKMSYELMSTTKDGRFGHYSPMQLLAHLHRDRDGICTCVTDECRCRLTDAQRRRLWALWAEWEQASRGKRQIGITSGLLAMLGLGPEWEPDDFRDSDDAAEVEQAIQAGQADKTPIMSLFRLRITTTTAPGLAGAAM